MTSEVRRAAVRVFGIFLLCAGVLGIFGSCVLLRFSGGVGYAHPPPEKDPKRVAPEGDVIVSPADGTVLYVRRIRAGVIPEVVKRGVPIPVVDHTRDPSRTFKDGYLVGIYMHTLGVHVNRIPNHGVVVDQYIYNGPHMDMTRAETEVGLTQAIPGLVGLKKLFGIPPYDIEGSADYILKSARETLVLEDVRGTELYVIRIADYYVGNIVTWVNRRQRVARGERLGMITWGSQTDLLIPDSPGLEVKVEVGQYVYGAETVVATY